MCLRMFWQKSPEENQPWPLTPQPVQVDILHLVSCGYSFQVFRLCWQGLLVSQQKRVMGASSSPFLSWLSSFCQQSSPAPTACGSYVGTKMVWVHSKKFTGTRPRRILLLFLLVFFNLLPKFFMFLLIPDYICFRLACYQ